MKYIVYLGIDKYGFKDGTTAVSFAELAMNNFIPSEYNKELKPLISIEDEKKNDTETNNGSGVTCIDCKYNDEGGYCLKNETTVDALGTCEAAERW